MTKCKGCKKEIAERQYKVVPEMCAQCWFEARQKEKEL